MDTRQFLRRYAYVYLYVVAFFLGCAGLLLHSVETAGEGTAFAAHPVIVIDAGHGGMDGGTTGISGVKEDAVNLAIARRLNAILSLAGYETLMTRTTAEDLSTEGETIRARKQSDLHNRAQMVNSLPEALLVSIHQNHYPDPRYDGPQVFHTPSATELANSMQSALNAALKPAGRRAAKPASGVYLLERSAHPAILVECGFLSNPAEEQSLASPQYQRSLAAVIASILAKFADGQV